MNFLCPFREDMLVDELGHAPPHKACESVLAATSLWINSIPSFLPGRGAKSLTGFGSSGVSFDVWGASQLWFCPSNKFINSAADFFFELKKVTSRFGFAPESLPVTLWQTIKRRTDDAPSTGTQTGTTFSGPRLCAHTRESPLSETEIIGDLSLTPNPGELVITTVDKSLWEGWAI